MTHLFGTYDGNSWEFWHDERPKGDDFWGYDTWKSDVGPWPSVGDDERRTRPELVPSFRECTELDLSGEEIWSAPDPEEVLDLAAEVVDLVEDIDHRTR